MARKVIIDVDPGIDDAVALCLALFDPRLDVLAVTATGGNVSGEQATRNVQAVIEQLDPPRLPRIGAASGETGYASDTRHINGPDGLGGANFDVAELVQRHSSDKVICEEVHASPDDVTIIALGPLTNIAAALTRDPALASKIGQLVMMGGTLTGPGNVTAAAEFNIHCHPEAARTVFQSLVTKTLIPLDVTSQVVMTFNQSDQLPGGKTSIGRLLEQILPFAFRSHRQYFGQESIHLHDAVAIISVLHPELFEMVDVFGDVETSGELTTGATVFDRRPGIQSQPNMQVASAIDATAVMDCIMRGLTKGA